MPAELDCIHTIPVYADMTPEQSWAEIVLADGDPIDLPVDGWANIGVWKNSSGEVFTAPFSMDDDPVGILPSYGRDDEVYTVEYESVAAA